MLTRMSRRARASAAITLLAASAAALPSLDWCPLPDWTRAACEALAIGAEPGDANEGSPCAGVPTACAMTGSAACDAAPPFCDVEPDPLPVGDKLWCVRPPATAITAKLATLPAPEASTPLAVLAAAPALAPPSFVAEAPGAHAPRPPTLRASHAPPQPRAPPFA